MASVLKKHIVNQQLFTKKPSLNIFHNEMNVWLLKGKKKFGTSFQINPKHNTSHIKFFTRDPRKDDVPINVGSEEEMWDVLREKATYMSGINFALGMRTDEGQLQVWVREDQPCQGGEMRKYGITHDDSTRPKDPRPGDLYYPFPDGTPLAVCSHFHTNISELFPHYVNKGSPYLRAYGGPNNVEMVGNSSVVIKDASLIDPTTMVYLFRKFRCGKNVFGELLNHLTPTEVVLFDLIEWKSLNFKKGGASSMYDVREINLKKFLKGGVEASYDLTGGSLYNRYDYNRPDIEYLFASKVRDNNLKFSQINDAVFSGKKPDNLDKLIKDLPRIREKLAELAA